MVHDPVEQGDDKYNSFLSSMFILRADVNFIIVQLDLPTVTHWNTSCTTIK